MGTKLGTNYCPAGLVQLPSKGNKWYVVITKPKALQSRSANKQVRRSTGTTDKRIAEAAKIRIANEIYESFDGELDALYRQNSSPPDYLALQLTNQITTDPNKFYTTDAFLIKQLGLDKDPKTKLSRFRPSFIDHLKTIDKDTHKERATKKSKLAEFQMVVGDLHIEDIKKLHAYGYAKWMATKGLANKTIRSNVSRVSAMLIWAEQEGVIDQNPFTNLRLSDYGRPSKPWKPFTQNELKQIFAQQMVPEDRLALTLLATTGARLDEIALLDWSQIKEDYGILYLDVTDAIVKGDNSRRIIPVHSAVKPMLSNPATGRVFSYSIDRDGKSQNAAG